MKRLRIFIALCLIEKFANRYFHLPHDPCKSIPNFLVACIIAGLVHSTGDKAKISKPSDLVPLLKLKPFPSP